MMTPPQLDQVSKTSQADPVCREPTSERRCLRAADAQAPSTPTQRQEPAASPRQSWGAQASWPEPCPLPASVAALHTPHSRAAATQASADHLSNHLCQPGQPLHQCLTSLYASADMAEHEIARSLKALRKLSDSSFPRLKRRGKVAVLLSGQQPFYALVTEVMLAATVSEQVRATTSFGPMQQVSMKIFGWLAQSMQARVSHAADGCIQQWQAETLGSVMLVHPSTADSAMRLSLALPAHPDVVLWTSSVDEACVVSLQAGGCPILMPQLTCSCTVVAEQSPANLAAAAAAVAVGLTRHRYRPGGVPAAILLHADIAADFIAQLMRRLAFARQPAPLVERGVRPATLVPNPVMQMRSLTSADWAATLLPSAVVDTPSQPLTLRLLSYRRDDDLTDYFDDIATTPLQVSLFGSSPAVSYAVPADRLRRGKTAIEAEDQLAARGGSDQLSLCRVRGNEVSFVSTSLMVQLRRALGPPDKAYREGVPLCLFPEG